MKTRTEEEQQNSDDGSHGEEVKLKCSEDEGEKPDVSFILMFPR